MNDLLFFFYDTGKGLVESASQPDGNLWWGLAGIVCLIVQLNIWYHWLFFPQNVLREIRKLKS